MVSNNTLINKDIKPLNVIDLFCGCGGMIGLTDGLI